MGYLERRVQYEKQPLQSHKQGRFVTTIAGHLEWPSGNQIDLHAFLTGHQASINLWPIETNIMRASGLFRGSFALVDQNRPPALGKIVVVRFNNQVIMRRLAKRDNRWCLVPDDPREQVLFITEFDQVERLGVVTYSIIEL